MSNKQVIAIFITGVGLLLAAFWAGLFTVKQDLPASVSSSSATPQNAGAPANQSNRQSAGGAAASGNGSLTTNPPGGSDDGRYIVLIGTFGTREQAKQLVDEMKRDYTSTFVKDPSGDDSLFHAAIGPYSRQDAEKVAGELSNKRRGITVKPWTPN